MADRVYEPGEVSQRHVAEMAAVKAMPTGHEPRLVTNLEIRHQVLGAGVVGRMNSRLALVITRAVGTMWAARSEERRVGKECRL